MALGDKIKGLFKRRILKEIENPDTRAAALDRAIEEAVKLSNTPGQTSEAIRVPIEEALAAFEELSLDELDVFRKAIEAFPDEVVWQQELVRRLTLRNHILSTDIGYLHREAVRVGRSLSLWRRLLEERGKQKDELLVIQARESMVVRLADFFPAGGESTWFDATTENEARSLFFNTLDEVTDAILKGNRTDASAERTLQISLSHFPESRPLLVHTAAVLRAKNRHDAEALQTALRALIIEPDDCDLKAYAGEMLAERIGHEAEGLAMLRQACELRPEDDEILGKATKWLCRQTRLEDIDSDIVWRWFRKHPQDIASAEMLADYYASRQDLGERAMACYRAAVKSSPNRARYLRLIGKAHASHGNWTEVISVFDSIHRSGDESEDIVIPLATAYAEMGRADGGAIGLYLQSLKLGSRHPSIHHLVCRHLYHTLPDEPDSVRQFLETNEISPDCMWARLGMIRHMIASNDHARALEDAIELLKDNGRDIELRRLAGEALAGNFKRQHIRLVYTLPSDVSRAVFEQAVKTAPDSLPLSNALVRQRLIAGLRDMETARLLAEVCKRDPDEVELRISRADLLWDLEQRDTAIHLYRELLERWRAMGGSFTKSGMTVSPSERSRILRRVADYLCGTGEPKSEDMDVLLEAAIDPDAEPEFLSRVARGMINTRHPHPMRLAFLERASAAAPGDEQLEQAVAEARAAKGNPRPALRLAIRRMSSGDFRGETMSLFNIALEYTRREHMTQQVIKDLDQLLTQPRGIPDPGLCAVVSALAISEHWRAEYVDRVKKAVDLAPDNPRLITMLARCHEAAGEIQKAVEGYRHVVALKPEDAESVVRLARTHARLQRYEPEVLDLAAKAHELEPNDTELTYHYAAVLLRSGRSPKATTVLTELVDKVPEMLPRIVALIDQTLSLDSTHGEILMLLAKLYIRMDRIEQGLVTLGRITILYNRFPGDFMQCYEMILTKDPKNARAWVERGILWKLSGDMEAAALDFEKALEIMPDNTTIMEEYIEVLERSLRNSSRPDADRWVRLAEKWLAMDSQDDALESIERALEIKPSHEGAIKLKAHCLMGSEDMDTVRQLLSRLSPSDTKTKLQLRLARRFEERTQYIEAAAVLTDALESSSGHREVLEQLRELNEIQARKRDEETDRQRIIRTLSSRAQSRYELRERIGHGAMGEVYIAYDKELDELVVLKILSPAFNQDEEMQARFRQEAKAARRLSHPNIVRIHDFGEEGGRKHISMEYLPEGTLKKFFEDHKRRIPLARLVDIVRQIARALVHAHQEGVLHLDIKPANIMMAAGGKIKLTDFGIAAIIGAGSSLKMKNAKDETIFGTPLYMSPEQFDGEQLGVSSDIYSLGILFYELLSGNPPFIRGSIAYHHHFTKPDPLPEATPEVLSGIVMKCLEKKPEDRYSTMLSFLHALDIFDNIRQGRYAPHTTPMHDSTKASDDLATSEVIVDPTLFQNPESTGEFNEPFTGEETPTSQRRTSLDREYDMPTTTGEANEAVTPPRADIHQSDTQRVKRNQI